MNKTTVKFIDLTESTAQVRKRYLAAIDRLLRGGRFILTPEVERFEKSWAAAVRTRYALGVSSGSDALYLSLRALDIGPGDEVITQGNAYNASVTAIMRCGARPRFADIDALTWRISPQDVERLIRKKTKAIMPVHLFGQMADMQRIMAIAKKHCLAVVEDAAQAHGASLYGRMAGAWGDIGAFSFYPTKNLGAFGDAGAVTTDSKALYEKMAALRNLGQQGKDNHIYYGFNMRLDAMQAIALSLKLKFLKDGIQKRIAAADRYDRMIADAGLPIQPLGRDPHGIGVWHLYPVLSLACPRDEVRRALARDGIETGVHYPLPVYRQPFFRGAHDPCPVADRVVRRILTLPMYEGITPAIQRRVIDSFTRACR